MGFCMSLDTLCSNAYGSRQYRLVGLHAQRVMLFLSLLCVPIALVWSQTEPLIRGLGLTGAVLPVMSTLSLIT